MENIAAAALSVFFTQSPSFLSHQKCLENAQGTSNAQSLFGISEIPTNNHILDPVPPQTVFLMFDRVFSALLEQGQLELYRVLDGQLLVALDGTEYHRSKNIHCPQSSVIEDRHGPPDYAHSVVTPVLVAPGYGRAFPLAPEFIVTQDGYQKQDCKTAAAKRWIAQSGPHYRQHSQITLLGDDLYSHQPMCIEALASNAIATLTLERRNRKRRETDTYRYAHTLPPHDGDDALKVNWCELITTDSEGKTLYHKAPLATNRSMTAM